MKKRYIIEDSRKHLTEQINSIEGIERTAMQENLVKNTKGLSAVIPKDNDSSFARIIKQFPSAQNFSLNSNMSIPLSAKVCGGYSDTISKLITTEIGAFYD